MGPAHSINRLSPPYWTQEEEGRTRLLGTWGQTPHQKKRAAAEAPLPLPSRVPFQGRRCPYRDHARALAWWKRENQWLRAFLARLPDPVAYQASRDTEEELRRLRLAHLEREYPGLPKDRAIIGLALKRSSWKARGQPCPFDRRSIA